MKSVVLFLAALTIGSFAQADVLNYDCGTMKASKGDQFVGSVEMKLQIDETENTIGAEGKLKVGPINKAFKIFGKITDSLFTDFVVLYWAESEQGHKVQVHFLSHTEIIFDDYTLVGNCTVL